MDDKTFLLLAGAVVLTHHLAEKSRRHAETVQAYAQSWGAPDSAAAPSGRAAANRLHRQQQAEIRKAAARRAEFATPYSVDTDVDSTRGYRSPAAPPLPKYAGPGVVHVPTSDWDADAEVAPKSSRFATPGLAGFIPAPGTSFGPNLRRY